MRLLRTKNNSNLRTRRGARPRSSRRAQKCYKDTLTFIDWLFCSIWATSVVCPSSSSPVIRRRMRGHSTSGNKIPSTPVHSHGQWNPSTRFILFLIMSNSKWKHVMGVIRMYGPTVTAAVNAGVLGRTLNYKHLDIIISFPCQRCSSSPRRWKEYCLSTAPRPVPKRWAGVTIWRATMNVSRKPSIAVLLIAGALIICSAILVSWSRNIGDVTEDELISTEHFSPNSKKHHVSKGSKYSEEIAALAKRAEPDRKAALAKLEALRRRSEGGSRSHKIGKHKKKIAKM